MARPVRPGTHRPHLGATTLVALRHAIIDAIILAADLPDDAVVDVRLTAGEDLGDDVVRAMTRALDEADQTAAQDSSRAHRLHAWVRDHRSLRATGEAVARHLRTVVRGA